MGFFSSYLWSVLNEVNLLILWLRCFFFWLLYFEYLLYVQNYAFVWFFYLISLYSSRYICLIMGYFNELKESAIKRYICLCIKSQNPCILLSDSYMNFPKSYDSILMFSNLIIPDLWHELCFCNLQISYVHENFY